MSQHSRSSASGKNDARLVRRPLAVANTLLCLALLPPAVQNDSIFPMVFRGGDDIRLLGNDAWFHLRHADYAAQHFPELLREDPQQLYGRTIRSDACSLFDLGIALVARVAAGGRYDRTVVAIVAAWTPVVLGVMCTFAVYGVVRIFAGRKLSLLAVLMFQLYPGPALPRIALGFADHHVAEILLMLLTLAGVMVATKSWREGNSRSSLFQTVLCVAPIVIFLFTWIGAPLYLGVIGLTFGIMLVLAIRYETDTWPIAVTALRYGSTALFLTATWGYLWPDGIIHQRAFRCGLLACVAITIVPIIVHYTARSLFRVGFSVSATAQIVVFTALLGVLVSAAMLPDVSQALTVFYRKSGIVAEQAYAANVAAWYLPTYGLPGLLCCAALPLVIQRLARSPQFADSDLALLSLSVAGSVIWLISRWVGDYEYVVAAVVPVLAAVTLRELLPAFSFSLRRRRPMLWAFVAALVLPIVPFGVCSAPLLGPDSLKHSQICHDGWREAMTWLKCRTPSGDALGTAASDSDYGVACAWEYGNLISVLGNRTPLWSRYPNPLLCRWVFEESQESADKILTDLCGTAEGVRYVLLDERSLSASLPGNTAAADLREPRDFLPKLIKDEKPPVIEPSEAFGGTIAHRLYFNDGANLGQYRLVFESSDLAVPAVIAEGGKVTLVSFRDDYVPVMAKLPADESVATATGLIRTQGVHSSIKVFERVRGASVVGCGPAGWNITVNLNLKSQTTGRRFSYTATTEIDEKGVFEIVVPHATVSTRHSDIVPAENYSLSLQSPRAEPQPEMPADSEPAEPAPHTPTLTTEFGNSEFRFNVTEADVRKGNTIDVGHLPVMTLSKDLLALLP